MGAGVAHRLGPSVVSVADVKNPASDPSPLTHWVAELRHARWRDDTTFELAGWAYLGAAAGAKPASSVRVYLQQEGGPRRLTADVTRLPSAEVNVHAKDSGMDHADDAFQAVFNLAPLLGAAPAGVFTHRWTAHVEVGDGEGAAVVAPFTRRYVWGSAGELSTEGFAGDQHVKPIWDDGAGLVFEHARRAVIADDIVFDGRIATGTLQVNGSFAPVASLIENAATKQQVMQRLEPAGGGRMRFSLQVPDAVEDDALWYVYAVDSSEARRRFHWSGAGRGREHGAAGNSTLFVRNGPAGVIRLEDHVLAASVTQVEHVAGDDAGEVTVRGTYRGVLPADTIVELRGSRQTLSAEACTVADGAFEARIPLVGDTTWARPGLAPVAGAYRLVMRCPGGRELTPKVAHSLAERLYVKIFTPVANLRIERDRQNHLSIDVRGPRPEVETGALCPTPAGCCLHVESFRREEAVYFESFSGKTASDNTLRLHDEIASRRPDLRRYWAVEDLSVAVPPGSTPIVIKSRRWWDVLASARYVVTNCWLSGCSSGDRTKMVLQAWHGTPLKLMGLDRPSNQAKSGYRQRTLREVAQWSILLAQNEYSADVFRQAYQYLGEVLVSGYPRNDILVGTTGAARRDEVRSLLGLPPQEKVILYAPTFRDGKGEIVRDLDLDALVDSLGPGHTVLVRGHANTLRHGDNLRGGV